MQYAVIVRLQRVVGLIYSVLLGYSHAYAAAAYDSSNLVVSGLMDLSSGLLWGHTQEKGSWKSCTAAVALCWIQDAQVHCLTERQNNCHQQRFRPNSTFCWDSKISQQYWPLTFTPGLTKNNSHFDTATDTVTDLVNVEREGNILKCRVLCCLPRSCLPGAYSRSFWYGMTGGLALTTWYFYVLCVCLQNSVQDLCEKKT